MGEIKIEPEVKTFRAAISLLESRFEHAPNQYEGLRREYISGRHGQIFVTFSRGNDNTLRDEKSTHIVMVQGARNPPSGDYYHMIKPLLEGRSIDRFTVVYFPFRKQVDRGLRESQDLVIDPMKVTYDLLDMAEQGVVNEKERVFVGGLSLGADLVAYAIQQGLAGRIGNYQGAILFDPACLVNRGRTHVLKLLKKFESLVQKGIGLNRLLQMPFFIEFITNKSFGVEKNWQKLLKWMMPKNRARKAIEIFSKIDVPRNINEIAATAGESALRLQHMFEQDELNNELRVKFPLHVAFTQKAKTEGYLELIKKKLSTLGEVVDNGILRGSHGASRGAGNYQSYIDVISTTVRM